MQQEANLFEQKRFLMIPGPTPVPESALIEMARHPLPHRSPEFSRIFVECMEDLKWLAQTTDATPFLYAASGTGAMEAALANTLSSGDKVISVVNGVFSKRWGDIAERFGAEVIRLQIEPGQASTPAQVQELLKLHPDTKMILLTFSETSTGVASPLKEIAQLTKDTEILLGVDAITALGAMPLYMDDWGIDVLLSGSQKGFMIPPGLSFVWASRKAIQKSKTATSPRFYWDWELSIKAMEKQTTAFTPAVSLVCALHNTLKLLKSQGLEEIWKRHAYLRDLTRTSLKSMGLKLFAADECASAAITSILPPEGIAVKDIRAKLNEEWKIIVADGQAGLQGKIFRIGHLGYVFQRDVLMAMGALAEVLQDLGYKKINANWQQSYREISSLHLQG